MNYPIPKHYEHIWKTVSCPICGHAQKLKFAYDQIQHTEVCDGCGKMTTFERELPGFRPRVYFMENKERGLADGIR